MGAGTLAAPAWSQASYPNRPIKLIVTVPPGGAADFIARLLAAKLSTSMGQPVVVENKAGASGMIAAAAVAKAAPDGLTIGIAATATHAINPWLYKTMPYNAGSDFAPITQMLRVPNVLVMNAETAQRLKISSLADLLAYAKANPGKLNYGSGGNGSAGHLAFEYLKLVGEIFVLHVPYRGTGNAVQDLLAGVVPMAILDTAAGLPQIRNNGLKARAGSGPVIAGLSDIAGNCLEDRHQGANPVANHVRGDDAGSRRAVVEGLDGQIPARPAFRVDG